MTAAIRPRTRAKAMVERHAQAIVAARSTPGAVEQATIRRDITTALMKAHISSVGADPYRSTTWLVEHFLPALDGVGLEIVRKRGAGHDS